MPIALEDLVPLVVDLVPTADHRDDRLVQALRDDTASAIAPTTRTLDEFVRALHIGLLPTLRVAHPVLERMLVARAVRDVLGREDGSAVGPVSGHVRALDAALRHGLTAELLSASVGEIGEEDVAARTRLQRFADMMAACDRALTDAGVVAAASVPGRLARAIDGHGDGPWPWPLGEADVLLRARAFPALDPTVVELFASIARVLARTGGRVELHLVCEPRRERVPAAIDRAVRAIEAMEDIPIELRFALREPDGPASRLTPFVEAVALGGRVDDTPVVLCEAQGPDEEARWVAAQIERWLREGHAPDEIAVVVRDAGRDEVEPVVRALDDASIPWRDQCGIAAHGTTVGRAALSLPGLVARGAPCDALFDSLGALVGHGTPDDGRPALYRLAAALRALRIDALSDPALDPRMATASARTVAPDVAHALIALRGSLQALAAPATIPAHARRLAEHLAALGGRARYVRGSHAIAAGAGEDPGARTILRAIARDEAALRAVATLLDEMVAHGATAYGDDVVAVGAFACVLEDVAALARNGIEGGDADGVRVVAADRMGGRSARAVAVVGVHEGGFPGRALEDSPLGDVERRAVLHTSGRWLERAGSREDETLAFLSVVASATETLALSGAKHDVTGRVLPVSPFMGDARRATRRTPVAVHRDPLARGALAPRGPDRTMRAWAHEPLQNAPWVLAPTLRSVRARAEVERERREFFAGVRLEPGRYSGRLDHDRAAVDALGLAHWASADKPLAVTTLERAARCGFRAFAQSVLGLSAPDEPGLTLDAKGRGHLLHALVEAGQLALRAVGDAAPEVRAKAMDRALDEAGRAFAATEPHADPELLRADVLAIRRQVEVFLVRRMDAHARWELVATEIAFGPHEPWSALEIPVEGQDAIVLQGRIDGVERMDDALRVVEFKSGRGDGFGRRLREGVLDTQFQLVVYAAALSRAADEGRVATHRQDIDGVYVGFRDQSEHTLRDALQARGRRDADAPQVRVEDIVRHGAHGQGALGDAVRRAVVPIRMGVFPARPRDCDFCDVHALCRIEHGTDGGDE